MSVRIFRNETCAGDAVNAGDLEITPVARSFQLRSPKFPAAFVWSRPVAVRVKSADGDIQEIPVRDITRQMQLLILASGFIGSVLIWLALRRKRTQNTELDD